MHTQLHLLLPFPLPRSPAYISCLNIGRSTFYHTNHSNTFCWHPILGSRRCSYPEGIFSTESKVTSINIWGAVETWIQGPWEGGGSWNSCSGAQRTHFWSQWSRWKSLKVTEAPGEGSLERTGLAQELLGFRARRCCRPQTHHPLDLLELVHLGKEKAALVPGVWAESASVVCRRQ